MHDLKERRVLSGANRLTVDFTHAPKLTRSQASLRRTVVRLRRVERVPPQSRIVARTNARLSAAHRVTRPKKRTLLDYDADDDDHTQPMFRLLSDLIPEIDEKLRATTRALLRGTHRWRLRHKSYTLEHTEAPYHYEVPLDELTTSAALLDWIFQIRNKGWCSPETLYELLAAIDHLIGPQSCLCPRAMVSGAPGKTATRKQLRARIDSRVADARVEKP